MGLASPGITLSPGIWGELLPVSPVNQRGLRVFGGQVLLPSCQHPPAQAAVRVISSSKRKCRGALAGMGKPCPWPAPPQALPADLHVPQVHPDGPKKAAEAHEGRSPTCPDPPWAEDSHPSHFIPSTAASQAAGKPCQQVPFHPMAQACQRCRMQFSQPSGSAPVPPSWVQREVRAELG